MATAQYSNGLVPLGEITVTTAGTPVKLNTNVGAQSQSAANLRGARRFRQIVVSAPAANTLDIIVLFVGNGALSAVVIDRIPPGQSRSYPQGTLLDHGSMNLDYFSLDASTNGNKADCYGIVA